MSRTYRQFYYLEAKMLDGGVPPWQNTAHTLIQSPLWYGLGVGDLNIVSSGGYLDDPLPPHSPIDHHFFHLASPG